MGAWANDSKSHVAHMAGEDFLREREIHHPGKPTTSGSSSSAGDGKTTVLKQKLALLEGEVIDAAVMNVAALRKFYAEQIEAAKKNGVLLSLHLKATMMKISDPDHVRSLLSPSTTRTFSTSMRRCPR